MHTSITPTGPSRQPRKTYTDPRQVDILRLLGRLCMMPANQLYQLVYTAGGGRTGVYKHLKQLHDEEKIWRAPVRYPRQARRTGAKGYPRKHPDAFGLTPSGKAFLADLGVEPDRKSLEALRCRKQTSGQQPIAIAAHDMLASWWCSSILLAVKGSRLCTDVRVQTEFVTHSQQRLDALVILRRNRARPRA